MQFNYWRLSLITVQQVAMWKLLKLDTSVKTTRNLSFYEKCEHLIKSRHSHSIMITQSCFDALFAHRGYTIERLSATSPHPTHGLVVKQLGRFFCSVPPCHPVLAFSTETDKNRRPSVRRQPVVQSSLHNSDLVRWTIGLAWQRMMDAQRRLFSARLGISSIR